MKRQWLVRRIAEADKGNSPAGPVVRYIALDTDPDEMVIAQIGTSSVYFQIEKDGRIVVTTYTPGMDEVAIVPFTSNRFEIVLRKRVRRH